MEPVIRIMEAKNVFEFAAIQWAAMRKNYFTVSDLRYSIDWTIEGITRKIRLPLSKDNFQVYVTNQLCASLAVLVIATDSVFHDYLPKEPPRVRDPNTERRAARCIIYMLRCAFAHNPIDPKWLIKKSYQHIWSVPTISLTIDMTDLNGKPIELEGKEFNWSNVLNLIDHCITYVD